MTLSYYRCHKPIVLLTVVATLKLNLVDFVKKVSPPWLPLSHHQVTHTYSHTDGHEVMDCFLGISLNQPH